MKLTSELEYEVNYYSIESKDHKKYIFDNIQDADKMLKILKDLPDVILPRIKIKLNLKGV